MMFDLVDGWFDLDYVEYAPCLEHVEVGQPLRDGVNQAIGKREHKTACVVTNKTGLSRFDKSFHGSPSLRVPT